MNDKIKYFLILTVYRAIAAAIILAVIVLLDFFAPKVTNRIECIWTKNTDFTKVTRLLCETVKELNPF